MVTRLSSLWVFIPYRRVLVRSRMISQLVTSFRNIPPCLGATLTNSRTKSAMGDRLFAQLRFRELDSWMNRSGVTASTSRNILPTRRVRQRTPDPMTASLGFGKGDRGLAEGEINDSANASVGSHLQVTWIGLDGTKPSCFCELRLSDEFIVHLPIFGADLPRMPSQLTFNQSAQIARVSAHDYANCLL